MSFDVAAEAYGRFMGCYSEPLAAQFVQLAGVEPGMHVLDVGCGPGALTAPLVQRLGSDGVSAIDPSESFVAAAQARCPGVDVRVGVAEDLPYADGSFTAALAQLVVHFMSDPIRGLAEMARVCEPGGVVAASVWDHVGDRSPLSRFWRAAADLAPGAVGESVVAGAREGHLAELAAAAGWTQIVSSELSVSVPCPDFDHWWDPYTLGVGPAGSYVARLDPVDREALRSHCADLLPSGPFSVVATAWTVCGRSRS